MVRCFLVLISLVSCFTVSAQEVVSDSLSSRNILKLNLTSFAFSAINLQYERKIGNDKSAALGLIYRLDGPVFNYIDRTTDSPIENPELTTIAITPEVKFYFNETFNGLYVGAYGRWRRNNVGYNYRHLDVLGLGDINFNYQENVIHIGALLGYQAKLTKDIYIDCWLLGFGISRSEINGTANADFDQLNRGYRIDRMFENLNGNYNRTFSYTTNSNEIKFYGEAYRAAFRGVGVSVGVRF